MVDAHTEAIRRNTEALNRLAAAQEDVARQMRISNMLAAAGYSANGFETSHVWAKALHQEALNLIGVRP